jgi:hypothetical protein
MAACSSPAAGAVASVVITPVKSAQTNNIDRAMERKLLRIGILKVKKHEAIGWRTPR